MWLLRVELAEKSTGIIRLVGHGGTCGYRGELLELALLSPAGLCCSPSVGAPLFRRHLGEVSSAPCPSGFEPAKATQGDGVRVLLLLGHGSGS